MDLGRIRTVMVSLVTVWYNLFVVVYAVVLLVRWVMVVLQK